ncbi:hypothetical protein C0389_05170 [bacterium]|nr:hypothetical protein [bacterium]
MNWKSDKQRQIIFLILIISGTLVLYSSEFFGSKKNNANGFSLHNESSIVERKVINRDTDKLFGIFLKNPASKAGIDALFNSIVFWDKAGNDSLIQSAIIVFEKYIKDDSLKNRFYTRLGKYFVDMNRKSQTTIGEIIERYSHPLKEQM